ncbi:MAG: hypothetical protein WBO17_09660, partial [Sphingorhabdus sp.]
MKKLIFIGLLASASSIHAQDKATVVPQPTATITSAPLVSESGPDAATRILRGGAQVRVSFLHEITTEDKASKVGDRPRLEVAENIVVDGVTVVP